MASLAMRSSNEVIVLGDGGHAKVVIDLLFQNGCEARATIGLVGKSYRSIPALKGDGALANFRPEVASFVVAVGDNRLRMRIAEETQVKGFSLAAPVLGSSASISPTAVIGPGTVVMNGVVINSDVAIGSLSIVNTGATIDHDCVIGNGVHIAPGVTIAGNVSVGEGAFIGAGATVIPGIRIGKWAVVGAGSTVIRDVPEDKIFYGTPAKEAH